MKNFLIIGALSASLFAATVHAGKGPPATEEERAQRMERMKAHLQLSDEQVAQIEQIRADGGGREQVRAVLSDEQLAKMDAMRKAHGGKRQGPPPTDD